MNNFPLPLFILLQWWCCKSNWGLKGGGFWLYPSRGQWEDGLFGYFICTVSIRAHSHFSLWKQVCLFSNIFCPLSFKFRCTLRIIVLHINIIKWYPLWGDFFSFFFCRGKKGPLFFLLLLLEVSTSEMIIADAGCVGFVVSAWMDSYSQHSQPIN